MNAPQAFSAAHSGQPRERAAEPAPEPALQPAGAGPLAWAGILLVTCGLLLVLHRVLFLVVPFLLALLLYYALMVPVQRLMLWGVPRERAALLMIALTSAVAATASLWLLPWLVTRLDQWPEQLARYLQGGLAMLDSSLRALERSFSGLQRAGLADQVGRLITEFGDAFAERHLAPLALATASWLPALLLAPFITFFMLREGRQFQRFLARAVPNAFFERTLILMNEVDGTARAYVLGLLQLTVLDTITLALGLWALGMPAPLSLGLLCAVLAWIPYVGSLAGGLLVLLVAATDFPGNPQMALWAAALFVLVRMLDDFVYMPLTIGKNLHMHPLVTVLMIFVGGAVAGVSGLMLVLPLLGVVMVVGRTLGSVLDDKRLMARWRHSRALAQARASQGL